MGADRRGPLAAFVIVALIAAILLVTSVRSQAAPWLSTRFVAGPATEPHLWGSVTGGVEQVVQEGTVLVRKAAHAPASDPTRTDAMGASNSVMTSRHARVSSADHLARTGHHPTAHHQPANKPDHTTEHTTDQGATDEPVDAPTTPPGHGRHLGWNKHHGQEQSGDSSDAGEASDPADADADADPDSGYAEHGHGHGHSYGHGHGHAYGHDRH